MGAHPIDARLLHGEPLSRVFALATAAVSPKFLCNQDTLERAETPIPLATEKGVWGSGAATSLAGLGAETGKRREARDLAGAVYAWFTAGFETMLRRSSTR